MVTDWPWLKYSRMVFSGSVGGGYNSGMVTLTLEAKSRTRRAKTTPASTNNRGRRYLPMGCLHSGRLPDTETVQQDECACQTETGETRCTCFTSGQTTQRIGTDRVSWMLRSIQGQGAARARAGHRPRLLGSRRGTPHPPSPENPKGCSRRGETSPTATHARGAPSERSCSRNRKST